MIGRGYRLAGAAAAGTILALVASGVAHAEVDCHVDGNYGSADFLPQGEKLYVEDYYADGWGTRAQLQVYHDPSRTWQPIDPVCFDDQSTGGADGVTVCDFNLAEGTQVRIHLWASKNGTTKDHHYSYVGVA